MKVRDLVKLLTLKEWTLVRQKGSHRQFEHPDKGLVVTVSGKDGKDVPAGTLKAILKATAIEG
jgi:predicted RNA binding protein YcfA (HicA-like mRNA interferase family)